MDLLASLHVYDLPEHQTRISSNPAVQAAFTKVDSSDGSSSSSSSSSDTITSITLGFDHCCSCAKPLVNDDTNSNNGDGRLVVVPTTTKTTTNISPSSKFKKPENEKNERNNNNTSSSSSSSQKPSKSIITCNACRRINYCSNECLKMDSDPFQDEKEVTEMEEDGARGHGPVVCALLRLCEVDEAVEKGAYDYESQKFGKRGDEQWDASCDRIRSELESYPATLSNLLLQSNPYGDMDSNNDYLEEEEEEETENLVDPNQNIPFYRPLLNNTLKIDQENNKEGNQQFNRCLTIHIIGASEEAELWYGKRGHMQRTKGHLSDYFSFPNVYDAYAEALTEVILTYHLDQLQLIFVGPDCPSKNVMIVKTIPCSSSSSSPQTSSLSQSKKRKKEHAHGHGHGHGHGNFNNNNNNKVKTCELIMQTHRTIYNQSYKSSQSYRKPHMVVFFNPGFTCPDYDWSEALQCVPSNTPYLVTTNTEMEGIADCTYLMDNEYISNLPNDIADIIVNEDNNDNMKQNDGEMTNLNHQFLTINLYAGSRVRQSGTMANDLFVKNRWILGGILNETSNQQEPLKKDVDKKRKKKKSKRSNSALM